MSSPKLSSVVPAGRFILFALDVFFPLDFASGGAGCDRGGLSVRRRAPSRRRDPLSRSVSTLPPLPSSPPFVFPFEEVPGGSGSEDSCSDARRLSDRCPTKREGEGEDEGEGEGEAEDDVGDFRLFLDSCFLVGGAEDVSFLDFRSESTGDSGGE